MRSARYRARSSGQGGALKGRPIRVTRREEFASPPVPVHREVLSEMPTEDTGLPPVLFVPGLRHGAWCFAEHWLRRTADRGFPAYAMSLRGHGASGGTDLRRSTGLREYVHDVMQVAASLPRRAVLVGHGVGGLVVAETLARYPAYAGVLVAPVIKGWRTLGSALLRHPFGTLPGAFGGSVGLRSGQLFSRRLGKEAARRYRARLDRSAPRVQYQVLFRRHLDPPIPGTPVLVVGSPDDRLVSSRALQKVAAWYGTEPLFFPGMGHDLMLDARWVEPIDAILDWLPSVSDPG
ncbi:MAG TPA: alpha/beta hydrolase [Micromonosporaceae bacterium]|jgi:pimeloyl-ACP methyl ester carboxylesterase|nr:alpha/beta hydrolase [Micromonosporaceae bacterium]